MHALLRGGDDYELLFTAHAEHRRQIDALSRVLACRCTASAPLTTPGRLQAQAADGRLGELAAGGFDHFL